MSPRSKPTLAARWLAPWLAALVACTGTPTPRPRPTPPVSAPETGPVTEADASTEGSTEADAAPPGDAPRPTPPAARTPDAPFRAEAPAPRPTPPFVAPRVTTFRLSNGMSVFLTERHELPVVVVRFVSRRGGDDLPVSQSGVAELTGALLGQGTTTRNALQLSDDFEAIGADNGTWMGWDSAGAYVKVLTPQLARAVELLSDVVQHPSFPAEELELSRTRRLAALRQQADSPRTIAGLVAVRAVYGDENPYGRTTLGTPEAVRAATRDQVTAVYQSHFVTADSALVVVGDARRATLQPLLEGAFGRWQSQAPTPAPAPPVAPAPSGPRVLLVDRPRAPQSFVVLAHAGPPRNTPDYAAVQVMSAILGGMFSSRVNLNLREQHAYTYGARAGYSFRRGPGPFSVGGAIIARATAPAIREMLNEMVRMRTTDVTDAELEAAKVYLTDSLPARFETADAAADAVSEIFLYGLPQDEYSTITRRIRAVTAADVRRVAETWLQPDHVRVIVVGDRAVVEPGVRELNLGELSLRSPLGDPLPSSPTPPAEAPPSAPPGTPPRR